MTRVTKQVVQNHCIIVRCALARSRDDPVVAHGFAIVYAEFDVGITYINSEKHELPPLQV